MSPSGRVPRVNSKKKAVFDMCTNPIQKVSQMTMFRVCDFSLDLGTPLHSGPQRVPGDFSLTHEGRAFRFNSTALAYSSRRVFKLLMENPLCRSLEVSCDEKSLRFFGDADSAVTPENIASVLELAVELEIESLFVAASLSDASSSLSVAQKIDFAVRGIAAGLSVVQLCAQLVVPFHEVLDRIDGLMKKGEPQDGFRILVRLVLRRYSDVLGNEAVTRACGMFGLDRSTYLSDSVVDQFPEAKGHGGTTRSRSNSRKDAVSLADLESSALSVKKRLDKHENTNELRGILRRFARDGCGPLCGKHPDLVDGCVYPDDHGSTYVHEFVFDERKPFDGILKNVPHEKKSPNGNWQFVFHRQRVFPTRIVLRGVSDRGQVADVKITGEKLAGDHFDLLEQMGCFGSPDDLEQDCVTEWDRPKERSGEAVLYEAIKGTGEFFFNVLVPPSVRDWYTELFVRTYSCELTEIEFYGLVTTRSKASQDAEHRADAVELGRLMASFD